MAFETIHIAIKKVDLEEIVKNISADGNYLDSPKKKEKLFRWCLNHLFVIIDKEGRRISFSPNKAQQYVIDGYFTHNRILVLKSRQLGITTVVCLLCLLEVMFSPNFKCFLISYKAEESYKAFAEKVRDVFYNIGYDLNNDERNALLSLWSVDKVNESELHLSFQEDEVTEDNALSKIYNNAKGIYRSGTGARGTTNNLIHVTEVDKLEDEQSGNIGELIKGTYQTLPIQGRLIIESTASKNYGYLKDTWDEAIYKMGLNKGVLSYNDFLPIFVGWRMDEQQISKVKPISIESFRKDRGIADFMNNQIEKYGLSPQEYSYYYSKLEEARFDFHAVLSEYPTIPEEAFAAPANMLFDSNVILHQKKINPVVDPKTIKGIIINYNPIADFSYSMGVDIASGRKGDNSACVIMCKQTGQEVCTFVSNELDVYAFAAVCYSLAVKYNTAFVVPEINYSGESFLRYFNDSYYSQIYNRVAFDRESGESREVQGFYTTIQSKITILNALKYGIENREYHLHSEIAIAQFLNCPKSFKEKLPNEKEVKNKVFKHFDVVIATALACEGLKSMPGTSVYVEGLSKPRKEIVSFFD